MNEYGELVTIICITGAWIHDRYRLFKAKKEIEYLIHKLGKSNDARYYMAQIRSEHD